MGRPTAGSSAAAFVAALASGGGWDSLGGSLGAEAVSHWEALLKIEHSCGIALAPCELLDAGASCGASSG